LWIGVAAVAVAVAVVVVAVLDVAYGLNPLTYAADRVGLTSTHFTSSFETGTIRCRICEDDGWVIDNESGRADALQVVGEGYPQRDGRYSLRIDAAIDDAWEPKPRVELSAHSHPFFDIGTEYWVGWSIYLPDDGGYEFDAKYQEIFLQVHGLNDDCDSSGVGPPHALRPIDGRWRWDLRWDPAQCMGPEPAGKELLDIGPQERGRWTDFVARFVFSSGTDGITQVWRDGELVVDRVGMPNHYNNEAGPYLKIGFYKAGWLNNPTDVTTRTFFYDAISVFEGEDGYATVDPARYIDRAARGCAPAIARRRSGPERPTVSLVEIQALGRTPTAKRCGRGSSQDIRESHGTND
jgi:hypothetical protein